jgi:DNA-binding HxlR family transcriptional regulator
MERLFETDSTMEDRFGKCPYATAQSLISGKWAVLIMHYLEDGPIRFNDLLRAKDDTCDFICSIKDIGGKWSGGAKTI